MSFIKTSPLKNRVSLYSDFHKDFTMNPLSNDVALKLDEESIKESLKNLILADRGEYLFQPNKGSDVRATLFEQNTTATLKILKEKITDVINNYEPRINLIDVEVISNYDSNKVKVNIIYYIRNRENPVTAVIFLERTR